MKKRPLGLCQWQRQGLFQTVVGGGKLKRIRHDFSAAAIDGDKEIFCALAQQCAIQPAKLCFQVHLAARISQQTDGTVLFAQDDPSELRARPIQKHVKSKRRRRSGVEALELCDAGERPHERMPFFPQLTVQMVCALRVLFQKRAEQPVAKRIPLCPGPGHAETGGPPLPLEACGKRVQQVDEGFIHQRLEKIVLYVIADRLLCILEITEAGNNDDRDAGVVLVDVLREGQAVHFRHFNVGYHHVNGYLLQQFHGFKAVLCRRGNVEQGGKSRDALGQIGPHQRFIINDHRVVHHGSPSQGSGISRETVVPCGEVSISRAALFP